MVAGSNPGRGARISIEEKCMTPVCCAMLRHKKPQADQIDQEAATGTSLPPAAHVSFGEVKAHISQTFFCETGNGG